MTTKTAGSLTTSNLTAVQANPSVSAISDADIATIAEAILYDQQLPQGYANAIMPTAFTRNGLLYIPARGVLKVLPGDWVAVDPAGWPVLLSSKTLPKTLTLTGNTDGTTGAITALSSSARTAGWEIGTPVSGTGIAAGSLIKTIAQNGLSMTLTKNTTSPQTGTTITAGSWTHS